MRLIKYVKCPLCSVNKMSGTISCSLCNGFGKISKEKYDLLKKLESESAEPQQTKRIDITDEEFEKFRLSKCNRLCFVCNKESCSLLNHTEE